MSYDNGLSLEESAYDAIWARATDILKQYEGAAEGAFALIAEYLESNSLFLVDTAKNLGQELHDKGFCTLELESPLKPFSMKIDFCRQREGGRRRIFYPIIRTVNFGPARYHFDHQTENMKFSLLSEDGEIVDINVDCLDTQDDFRTCLEDLVSFQFKSERSPCVLSQFEASRSPELLDILFARSAIAADQDNLSRVSTQQEATRSWLERTFRREL